MAATQAGNHYPDVLTDVSAPKMGKAPPSNPHEKYAFGTTDLVTAPSLSVPWGSQDAKLDEHQKKVPRLPVPDLVHTCVMYLRSLRPLLSEEEFDKTSRIVWKFMEPHGEGEKLRAKLCEYDDPEKRPSWLEEWWDESYLGGRDPIALNVNYFFAFEDDPEPSHMTQVGRGAALVNGALMFYQKMKTGDWKFDFERDHPLDMSQYKRVFACCRIPGQDRDHLITFCSQGPDSRSMCSKTSDYIPVDPQHIVVLCKNNFFTVDVIDKDGKVMSIPELEAAFNAILTKAEERAPPVGVFTTGNRTEWANIREHLIDIDHTNFDTLSRIESAILCVCLDMIAPANDNELSCLCLHGPGTNRWFDRMNLIVTANGRAGLNFEHSEGDGATTLYMADSIHKHALKHTNPKPLSANVKVPEVHKLQWKLGSDDKLETAMRAHYEKFRTEILANESYALRFKGFGADFIKSAKQSPDAFTQVAFQLAMFKMTGKVEPTYESASTRAFFHGRTECVRSCSQEALEFCKWTETRGDAKEGLRLMERAIEAHVDYMKRCKEGQGCDRGLLGMRMIAEIEARKRAGLSTDKITVAGAYVAETDQAPAQLPAIFADPVYNRSSHWVLSTSNCGAASLMLFGFGPVCKEGVGLGYIIKNDCLCFNITTKHGMKSARVFATFLKQALLHMQAIVLLNPTEPYPPCQAMSFTHPTVDKATYPC